MSEPCLYQLTAGNSLPPTMRSGLPAFKIFGILKSWYFFHIEWIGGEKVPFANYMTSTRTLHGSGGRLPRATILVFKPSQRPVVAP